MNIVLNGEQFETDKERLTVSELLAGLSLKPNLIAVAINYECVPRKNYGDTRIQPGDVVEVLTPHSGG